MPKTKAASPPCVTRERVKTRSQVDPDQEDAFCSPQASQASKEKAANEPVISLDSTMEESEDWNNACDKVAKATSSIRLMKESLNEVITSVFSLEGICRENPAAMKTLKPTIDNLSAAARRAITIANKGLTYMCYIYI